MTHVIFFHPFKCQVNAVTWRRGASDFQVPVRASWQPHVGGDWRRGQLRLWFICLCKSTEWLTQQKRVAFEASNLTQMPPLFSTSLSPRKATDFMSPCSTVSSPARHVCRGELAALQIQADSWGSPGRVWGGRWGWLSGISLSRWRTVADKVMMNTFHFQRQEAGFFLLFEKPPGAKIQHDFTSQKLPSCCT